MINTVIGNKFHVSIILYQQRPNKPVSISGRHILEEDFAKASADISTLRQARYQTYGSATLTSENWLDEIDKERLRELFMEGFRLQDLKRWGKGFERKPQEQSVRDGSSLKIEAGNPLFVWPIPQHELDLPGSAIEPNESNK